VGNEVGRAVVEHEVVDDRDLGRHGEASGTVRRSGEEEWW
jgi:hypothetical protein